MLWASQLHGFTQYTSLKMENYNCHTISCIPTFSNHRQYLKRDIFCFEMLFTLSFKDSKFLKGSLLQFRLHQHMSYIEFPKHLFHFYLSDSCSVCYNKIRVSNISYKFTKNTLNSMELKVFAKVIVESWPSSLLDCYGCECKSRKKRAK